MQQGFLHQILRQRPISADQPIEIAEQRGVVARHQRGECHLIACQHGSYQQFVASLLHRARWSAPSLSYCCLARARATKGSQSGGSATIPESERKAASPAPSRMSPTLRAVGCKRRWWTG